MASGMEVASRSHNGDSARRRNGIAVRPQRSHSGCVPGFANDHGPGIGTLGRLFLSALRVRPPRGRFVERVQISVTHAALELGSEPPALVQLRSWPDLAVFKNLRAGKPR